MTTVEEILKDGGHYFGRFTDNARLVQDLKRVMFHTPRTATVEEGEQRPPLDPDQREALEMIAHHIGNILCGDPNYAEPWVAIGGYAHLVAFRLKHDLIPAQAISKPLIPSPRPSDVAKRALF